PGRLVGKLAKGVGRGVVKVARVAAPFAGFIPGVGPLANRLLSIAAAHGVSPDVAVEFARSYGIDMGDPDDYDTEEAGMGMSGYMGDDYELDYMGDPAPKPARKRKGAASGPRAKAEKKRAKRRERSQRKGDSLGTKIGKSIGVGAKATAAALPGLLEAFKSGGPTGAMAHMAGGVPTNAEDAALAEMAAALGGRKGARGFGGKRRTMNPANVKALRRGIRRIEGFQHLVKRVNKMFPAMRGHATTSSSPRRSKGHRAGCGCVVCKR
ncbi:MAG TPA: hypothetical protein VGQ06_14025, partial [Gemmatimonadales bacterium]|nr:hypothetical protein [Gemmatimonadales bacterium]